MHLKLDHPSSSPVSGPRDRNDTTPCARGPRGRRTDNVRAGGSGPANTFDDEDTTAAAAAASTCTSAVLCFPFNRFVTII